MNAILLGIASTLIGPISGLVTTRLMDFIDDGMKLTASWPTPVKQILVMALAAIVPVANAQLHLVLPADPSAFFASTNVQYIVGLILAFIFKHGSSASKTAAIVSQPLNVKIS